MKTLQLLLFLLALTISAEELVLASTCDSSWIGDSLTRSSKGQYTYKNGKVEYFYYSSLDTTSGEVELLSRQVFTFSENGAVQQNMMQYIDPETKVWFDSSKYIFRFDDNRNMIAFEVYNKGDNDWIPYLIVTSAFNAESLKEWDSTFIHNENGEFYNGTTARYSYNSNGLETEWFYEVYSNGEWTNDQKRIRSYEGSFLTEELTFSWENESWEPNRVQTFLKEGNKISGLEQRWIADTLKDVEREIRYLNGQALDSLVEVSDCNNKNEWIQISRKNIAYNRVGNITEEITELWDSTEYVNSLKRVVGYTADTLRSSNKYYSWSGDEWIKTTVSYTDYKPMGQIEALLSVGASKAPKEVRLLPNQLFAPQEAKELIVYNMQGRIVTQIDGVTQHGQTLFALSSGLAKAPYILQLIGESGERVVAPFVHSF